MQHEIKVKQVVSATPEEAYDAFMSQDRLEEWWWPHLPTRYRLDPRVGGSYSIISDVGIGVEGRFLELSRPSSISMTWHWLDDGAQGAEEPVRIRFETRGQETVVEVTHLCSPESADDLERGWKDVLARLEDLFRTSET